ncbi:MAG: hypothetical protein KTR13_09395 [Saprospiraceae bacterium]|nr:hypothetical protein [Saprospiraceae bacterium]
MKHFFIIYLLALFTACSTKNSEQGEGTSNSFDWLLGEWEQTNTDATYYETWEKTSDTIYEGIAVMLDGTDTLFQETITLLKTDEEWQFQVIQNGESNPTIFVLDARTATTFSCSNPENEFPKQIKYSKSETGLFATISDSERKIDFEFAAR